MFQMMGVFAEFDRAMIVERVKAGLSRARSQGKRLGRRPVSEAVVGLLSGVSAKSWRPEQESSKPQS
jgi:DNA invertase Pin-like site-specific DNA recombinase